MIQYQDTLIAYSEQEEAKAVDSKRMYGNITMAWGLCGGLNGEGNS